MDVVIKNIETDAREVEIEFTKDTFNFRRNVNAVFDQDRNYDSEATKERVREVTLGVINKMLVGTIQTDVPISLTEDINIIDNNLIPPPEVTSDVSEPVVSEELIAEASLDESAVSEEIVPENEALVTDTIIDNTVMDEPVVDVESTQDISQTLVEPSSEVISPDIVEDQPAPQSSDTVEVETTDQTSTDSIVAISEYAPATTTKKKKS